MHADIQPATDYRLPTTACHPRITSLRAKRGNLPIHTALGLPAGFRLITSHVALVICGFFSPRKKYRTFSFPLVCPELLRFMFVKRVGRPPVPNCRACLKNCEFSPRGVPLSSPNQEAHPTCSRLLVSRIALAGLVPRTQRRHPLMSYSICKVCSRCREMEDPLEGVLKVSRKTFPLSDNH